MNNVQLYGEDGCTLWSLSTKVNSGECLLIWALRDQQIIKSDDDVKTIFYRPSFGRGGSGIKNFGEFDVILVTVQKVVCIECKWQADVSKPIIGPVQIRRHIIFQAYWEAANKCMLTHGFDWDIVRASLKDSDYFSEGKTKNRWQRRLVKKGENLAKNLERILQSCSDSKRTMSHVLVAFNKIDGSENVKQFEVITSEPKESEGWKENKETGVKFDGVIIALPDQDHLCINLDLKSLFLIDNSLHEDE